jgi:hypothetical protein
MIVYPRVRTVFLGMVFLAAVSVLNGDVRVVPVFLTFPLTGSTQYVFTGDWWIVCSEFSVMVTDFLTAEAMGRQTDVYQVEIPDVQVRYKCPRSAVRSPGYPGFPVTDLSLMVSKQSVDPVRWLKRVSSGEKSGSDQELQRLSLAYRVLPGVESGPHYIILAMGRFFFPHDSSRPV